MKCILQILVLLLTINTALAQSDNLIDTTNFNIIGFWILSDYYDQTSFESIWEFKDDGTFNAHSPLDSIEGVEVMDIATGSLIPYFKMMSSWHFNEDTLIFTYESMKDHPQQTRLHSTSKYQIKAIGNEFKLTTFSRIGKFYVSNMTLRLTKRK